MQRLHDQGVVLVLDEEKGDLGGVALALISKGIDALYSNDGYEAALLARQEGRRVGGMLVSADAPVRRIDEIIETICPEAGLDPESIAVVGDRPPGPILSEYLDRGLRWCLWRPHDDNALGFIGGLTLWESNDVNLRLDVRVPVRVDATLSCRGQPQAVRLTDLSRGGARLDVATRLPPGRRVKIEVHAKGAPFSCTAIVRWTTAFRRKTDLTPPGMGIEFERPSRAGKRALERLLDQAIERFRIPVDSA